MQALREQLDAAGWPFEWREREGGHQLMDEDLEAVVEFILELAEKDSL